MLRERHFNRCLAVIGALWVLELGWIALPGDPTTTDAPWGAVVFFGGLLFGTWMRARPAYWVLVASEGFAVYAALLMIPFLAMFGGLPLIVFAAARFALLLSRPVRTMIGTPRYRVSAT